MTKCFSFPFNLLKGSTQGRDMEAQELRLLEAIAAVLALEVFAQDGINLILGKEAQPSLRGMLSL